MAESHNIEQLVKYLDEAGQDGHLPDPSLAVELEDTNKANTRSYIKAIRSRLIDLGYLAESTENRGRDFLDNRLKKAIAKFQKESGLKEDTWVGKKTWQTLQQLVSFEDDQEPDKWCEWLKKDFLQRAVLRAVYLRLYALGFFLWSEKLNRQTNLSLDRNHDFKTALKKFIRVSQRIGILDSVVDPEINEVTLRALFQQDEIIHALNRNPDFVSKKANKKFVNSVARIELWMLGFDVSVGNPQYRLKKRRNQFFPREVTYLSDALEQFWEQQPAGSKPSTQKALRNVTPDFFRQLIEFEDEDRTPDAIVEDNLVEQLNDFSDDDRQELKNRLLTIAGSIWDGVKRVFRWIKRFIKKIITKTMNTIKNLARFIAKHARSVFKHIKKVFEIIHRARIYMRNKMLPGSDPRHIAIYHFKDFDTGIFVNLNADPAAIHHLLQKNRIESKYFTAACRILSYLVDIIGDVTRTLVFGITGWFIALLTLSKLAIRINKIQKEIDEVEPLVIDPQISPFLNLAD